VAAAAPVFRAALLEHHVPNDEREIDIGEFVIGDGRAGSYLAQPRGRNDNADLSERPAQPVSPPAVEVRGPS